MLSFPLLNFLCVDVRGGYLELRNEGSFVGWGFGAAGMSQVREINAIGLFCCHGLVPLMYHSASFSKEERGLIRGLRQKKLTPFVSRCKEIWISE